MFLGQIRGLSTELHATLAPLTSSIGSAMRLRPLESIVSDSNKYLVFPCLFVRSLVFLVASRVASAALHSFVDILVLYIRFLNNI